MPLTGSSDALIQAHKALMVLSHNADFVSLPRSRKLALLVDFCIEKIGVGRVSIWNFTASENSISCELLHDTAMATALISQQGSLQLSACDHPVYFDAIRQERVLAANDARQDPRTASFAHDYLLQHGVRSMLDAPVFDGDRLAGIICLESRQLRKWTLLEISLVVAIANTISLINTHDAWLRSKRALDFVTHYDPLTSLANLTSLKSRIQSLSDPSNQPKNQAFSLIWIDIDRIKTVNDGLGTQAGDQVIVEIGQRLDRLHISGKDLLGRVGGDEFALIIRHQPSADTLALIAATLRDLIAEPLLVDQQPLSVTASIGICCYPENFTDTEELMRGAETAMYTAKQAGTSQFALFNPDHQSSARSRFRLESSLRTAIEQNALDVFYQPIFNRAEDSLDGMEALVRWNHPEHGWMSPIEFLDVARAAGLMYALGACVLRRVCRDWRDSQNLEQWLPVLSVNLSAEQVLTPEFPALVRSICAEYQMPVSALQFEVTEDAIQGDMECVHRVLQDLVDQGARLAIDDFGTGYSSLSRLKNLPVSRIKIDRSFVNGLPNDADDCAITLSIIGLARGLGLSVVAEGVETEAHEHWLLEQGCHYFQGYLYSKPLPLQACRETFLNNLTAIPEQPN